MTYDRWQCPKCRQENEPDAYPKCSWCSFYHTRSDTGRLMERGRTPKTWEMDRGVTRRATDDGWPVPGCVSPADTSRPD